jgi:hypothetical protein
VPWRTLPVSQKISPEDAFTICTSVIRFVVSFNEDPRDRPNRGTLSSRRCFKRSEIHARRIPNNRRETETRSAFKRVQENLAAVDPRVAQFLASPSSFRNNRIVARICPDRSIDHRSFSFSGE